MAHTIGSFIMEAGKLGGVVFGVIVLAFMVTFIVITGCMVLFLIYKQVFFPTQKKSESLQYTLFKNLALPFITSAVNDLTKKANSMVEEKNKQSTKKVDNAVQ